MRAEIVKLVEIVNRRAATAERRIQALRKTQARQREAIRQLEIAHSVCTSRLKQMGSLKKKTVSARQLEATSQDGKDCEERLQQLRESQRKLHAELQQTSTQIQSHCSALVALRRKADYLNDRKSAHARKVLRRELARECVST